MISIEACAGCGIPFSKKSTRHIYCTPKCRPRGKRQNYQSQEHKRDEWRDRVANFVAVDGEGFRRQVEKFTPIDSVPEEELDELDEMLTAGDIEIDIEVDDEGVATRGFYELVERHQYEMLTVGDQTLGKRGEELKPAEVFEFLYSHFEDNQDKKKAYVGFFLSYDFTMWLRNMSERHARALLTKEGKERRTVEFTDDEGDSKSYTYPVTLWKNDGTADFEIEMLGHKRLSIRRHIASEDRVVKDVVIRSDGKTRTVYEAYPYPWLNICDAGSFFATSLLNAINPKGSVEPIVSDEEFALLKRGKDNRDSADFDDATMEYNVLENEVLKRLMTQLDGGFRSVGIHLKASQYYGPGAAAQAMMKEWGVPTGEELREVIPPYALQAGMNSYYGGWFETSFLGQYPEDVIESDVNSAYPAALEKLPCLLHATCDKGDGKPPVPGERDLTIVHVRTHTFEPGSHRTPLFGGLSHREASGSIMHPLETEGWHFLAEVHAAIAAGTIARVEYLDWVQVHPTCACANPFGKIRELYNERLKVGKNTARGIALKIVYNSMYGKTAQTVGKPKYGFSLYASYITSYCRTMILNAMAKLPNQSHDVLMIATDGIYTKCPIPGLDVDPNRMGAWDVATKEGFTAVMPGVHWDNKTRNQVIAARIAAGDEGVPDYSAVKIKSRGVSSKAIGASLHNFDEMFADLIAEYEIGNPVLTAEGEFPQVTIHIDFSLTSAKLALARNKWHTAGHVESTERVISSNPQTKRAAVLKVHTRTGASFLKTLPYEMGAELATQPYRALFGAPAQSLFTEDFDGLVTESGQLGGQLLKSLGKI
jgi:hypothetical protein